MELPFGTVGRVGQRNDVLDGGPDAPTGRGKFLGNGAAQECGTVDVAYVG